MLGRAELDKVKAMIQEVNEKDVGENKGGSTTRQQLDKLHDQRRQLMVKFDGARHRAFKERGRAEMVRREERAAVLRDAEVVLCTLSSAGGDLLALARMVNSSDSRGGVRGPDSGGGGAALFDAIIIDEAAQAVEPAALIPLQLLRDGRKIILVGDTNQLPPTVKSQAPGAVSLSQSLFARMQSARYPMLMLDEQYRMHPAISAFPCRHFYDGKLRDGVKAVAAPFHQVRGAGHPASLLFPDWA